MRDSLQGRPDRRALLSGLVASGSYLAFPSLMASAACAQRPGPGPVLRSADFPSFRDAVAHWSATGGTLIVNTDHEERLPITMICVAGSSYHLTSDGPRRIAYAGPHYHWLFCIYSPGLNSFVVDGNLTFDGRNSCSIPFFARFEPVSGDRRRDFTVAGLTARNARMRPGVSRIDGSRSNAYGATGMLFMGGFDHLHLRDVKAMDVTRDAGAGLLGSQGCVGIGVVAIMSGTQSARHVTIEDFEVARVDSDDRPGTVDRNDMDGVLVFQSPEADGSRPIIQRGTIREAAGRAVKVYAPGGGGATRDLVIYRSVHGKVNGSNDVAHQHGDGLIENIIFHYAGNAHSQPTVPIGMSSGTARDSGFPFAEGVIRNVTINDTTGQPKRAIISIFYMVLTDASPRRYAFQNIRDSGTAQHLFVPGFLGSYGDAEIDIDEVSVNLTTGLMATEDYSRHLRVIAHRLINRNARPVPFKVFYDGRAAPPNHGGTLIVDDTDTGIIR
jgi:hypothetical protein